MASAADPDKGNQRKRKQQRPPGSLLAQLTLILLLAFALGVLSLNSDIVWLDEMFSLGNMGAFDPPYSPAQVIDSLAANSPDHAPLYFVLGAQWSQIVGWTQLPARMFSLLMGVLLAAQVFRLAATLESRRAGLYAALMLSTSGFVLLYFHEIRMYTLLMFLAVWHVTLYFRLVAGASVRRRTWVLFVLTTSALIYTHVYASFLFAALVGQHVVFAERSRRWVAIILAWCLGAATFLPYLPIFASGFADVTTSSNTAAMAYSLSELLGAVVYPLVNDMLLLWLPIIAMGGWLFWRSLNRKILRLSIIVAFTFTSIFVFNAFYPVISINRMRYFLIAMPLLIVVFASILANYHPRRLLIALIMVVWVAGGLQILSQAERWKYAGHQTLLMDHPPLHRFADALYGKVRPQDYLLGFAGSPAINWRLKHGYSKADFYTRVALSIDGAFVNARLSGDELLRDIDARIDDHPYLLFAYDPSDKSDVFDDVLLAIRAEYIACEILVDQKDVHVQRYTQRLLSCDREYQPIFYDNGIEIVDKYAVYNMEAELVQVLTGWEVADEAQLQQYNVSIQIFTPDNQKVLQARDRHLYNDVLKWYALDISVANLPAGDYRVVVIVYDRYQSSSKARGVDSTTGEEGTILPLLHFKIEE